MTGPQYPQQPYGQPYPQQPYPQPPKKRKVWPWVLLAVVVLMFGGCFAILGTAGHEAAKAIDAAATSIQSAANAPADEPIPPLSAKPPTGKGKTIVYEIISDADLNSVTYWDGNSELQQETSASAPWTKTIINNSTVAISGVGAQTNGSSVTCRVTVDGKVKQEKTATGKYALVNCNG
ncbi:MmpS family transport accessory protein [Nocardia sp. NPDC051911]|uniref:MmpS family transport accessory protein n=1 Tax=Nocardia sp. NPDC051911 TaxID=3154648 RepID=UPI00342C1AF4